jgi:hypothetical protein
VGRVDAGDRRRVWPFGPSRIRRPSDGGVAQGVVCICPGAGTRDAVKTNSVTVTPAERAPEAVVYLERTLERYQCAAWVKSDGELAVTLDLQGTSPTQRMAAGAGSLRRPYERSTCRSSPTPSGNRDPRGWKLVPSEAASRPSKSCCLGGRGQLPPRVRGRCVSSGGR